MNMMTKYGDMIERSFLMKLFIIHIVIVKTALFFSLVLCVIC